MFRTAPTKKGNIGVSTISMELAEAQAAEMDAKGCRDCINCAECVGCRRCRDCIQCSECFDCRECTNCSNCHDCVSCTDCLQCHYCLYSAACVECRHCVSCTGCTECHACNHCNNCHICYASSLCENCRTCNHCWHCKDCRESSHVSKWEGPEASELIVVQGLTWPVAISETHMQIGCQNRSHEEWRSITITIVELAGSQAADFYEEYGSMLDALCSKAAQRGQESK